MGRSNLRRNANTPDTPTGHFTSQTMSFRQLMCRAAPVTKREQSLTRMSFTACGRP